MLDAETSLGTAMSVWRALVDGDVKKKLVERFAAAKSPAPNGDATSAARGAVHIDDLPQDVLLRVFAHLDPRDAVRLQRVSVEWCYLLHDEQLWKGYHDARSAEWTSHSSTLRTPEHACRPLWRNMLGAVRVEIAKAQREWDAHTHGDAQSDASDLEAVELPPNGWREPTLSQMLQQHPVRATRWLHTLGRTQPRVAPVCCTGAGLTRSARGLFRRLMWDERSPLPLGQLHKGQFGVGSGVGFVVGDVELNVISLYDLHGRADAGLNVLTRVWHRCIDEAGGVCFIVDTDAASDDVLVAARAELARMHEHAQLSVSAADKIPLLILACASTRALADAAAAPRYVAEQLGVAELAARADSVVSSWRVQCVCAEDFTGVRDAFTWLANAV